MGLLGSPVVHPRSGSQSRFQVSIRGGCYVKIAILDDYQQMALGLADWNALPSVEEVRSFAENIGDPTELVRALRAFDVIVAMRERTRFPADVIDALPNL